MRKLLTVIIAITSLGASYAFGDASFQGVGGAYYNTYSHANGISANGSTVIGRSGHLTLGVWWGWRWTEEGGYQGLPSLPVGRFSSNGIAAQSADGGVMVGYTRSQYSNNSACFWVGPEYNVQSLGVGGGASGVSADGSVIIGNANAIGAFRWTQATGVVALGNSLTSATAISADGSVIVGQVGYEAFRWSAATGMVMLGGLPGVPGPNYSRVSHVSSDGSVIVGRSPTSGEAYRWTAATGMVGLGFTGAVDDINSDGSVIVGTANQEALRWTAATGPVSLGLLPGVVAIDARVVSNDGSIIVGRCFTEDLGQVAWVWDQVNGMRFLQNVLVNDFGLDLTGWNLQVANDISADGQKIVGLGTNPDGYSEGWVATIPALTTSVAGSVTANCPAPNTGLASIMIDLYEQGTGDLVISVLTDVDGNYLIEDLTPGDYIVTGIIPLSFDVIEDEVPITLAGGATEIVDFSLTCIVIDSLPPGLIHTLSSAYWKGQVGKLLKGKIRDIDAATLCGYLDMIAGHFNSNVINQVVVYEPPTSGVCMDKLLVAGDLLNARGDSAEVAKARKQLMALLLNVASGKLSQTAIISVDGATVSQAITYCDNIIDDPNGDYHLARDICKEINKNQEVAAGVIDLGTENIAYKQAEIPLTFSLVQNYPNPFNPTTEISFSLPSAADVKLEIYNIMGQRVTTLVNERLEAGEHIVQWDGSEAASGVYFYRLQTDDFVGTKKMILLK